MTFCSVVSLNPNFAISISRGNENSRFDKNLKLRMKGAQDKVTMARMKE